MNKGIIYLIQPCEFINSNIYKIGCSSKADLSRCKNGYGKGTRYICIQECNNPFELEKNIKNSFNNKYKLYKGKEYFEGNEKSMYDEFIKILTEHKNNEEKSIKIKQKPNEKCSCGSNTKFKKCCGSNTKHINKDDLDICDVCDGSGISYWSDYFYGSCLECRCIDCEKVFKNCKCTSCNKCNEGIRFDEKHECEKCVKCNKYFNKMYKCICEYSSDSSDSECEL
jgi:hypothetical protein